MCNVVLGSALPVFSFQVLTHKSGGARAFGNIVSTVAGPSRASGDKSGQSKPRRGNAKPDDAHNGVH